MRRAGETWVITADRSLDAVQHSLLQLAGLDVLLRDRFDRAVHREVVVARGDDKVDLLDPARFVDPVVMEQRAARRLHDTHTLLVGRSDRKSVV